MGYVYLILFNHSMVKIGKADDYKSRIYQLKKNGYQNHSYIRTIDVREIHDNYTYPYACGCKGPLAAESELKHFFHEAEYGETELFSFGKGKKFSLADYINKFQTIGKHVDFRNG